MNLPTVSLATATVEVAGQAVAIRSLSRAEALKLQEYAGKEDEAEDFLLSCSLDISIEEAHKWRDAVDVRTGQVLVEAIIELSGLTAGPKALSEDS